MKLVIPDFPVDSKFLITILFLASVIVLETIKRSLLNHPEDWIGDPCFPAGYSWTGITCSNGTRVRIISM